MVPRRRGLSWSLNRLAFAHRRAAVAEKMNRGRDGSLKRPIRPTAVSLEDVLDFVFVKKRLQHPQTVGRLLAFGLFGPLDADKQLRSGQAVRLHPKRR